MKNEWKGHKNDFIFLKFVDRNIVESGI